MIEKIADIVWRAVEKVYSLPDDIFDFEDDENAIIEE
jgi:outer membrane lipoprotein-sorting protein